MQVVAHITAGRNVLDNLVRFQAQVSSLREGYVDAIAKAFSNNVLVLEDTLVVTSNIGRHTPAKIVEGFGLIRPVSKRLDHEKAAAEIDHLGLTCVASNIYLDPNQVQWRVEKYGDSTVISRDTNDDVAELIETANRKYAQENNQIKSLVDNKFVGVVGYVNEAGSQVSGYAFAGVEGNSDLLQVIMAMNMDGDPVMVDTFQVIASDDLADLEVPEDIRDLTGREYYKAIYSRDPAAVDILNTMG